MKYWEDFDSKFGFGDGDAVPPDAWALRYVYVREINRLAKKNGSAVRAFAFDRPGMHNSLLILRAPASLVDDKPEKDVCAGGLFFGTDEPPEDDGYRKALVELEDSNVDDLVVIGEVTILDGPAEPF